MPYVSDLDGLVDLGNRARERSDWVDFARYCDFRGRGIRSTALAALGEFLDRATNWPFDARLMFVRWVLEASVDFKDRTILLPQPIQQRLLIPTVREWSTLKPKESQAHLWLGLLRCDNPSLHLERALELSPSSEQARQTLVEWTLADVSYNQHELPEFYIHDPRRDLSNLDGSEKLIAASADKDWAKIKEEEIIELRSKACSWLAAHPGPGDFAVH